MRGGVEPISTCLVVRVRDSTASQYLFGERRSYNITALAVNAFDNTYAAVLHPLDFRIKPMANAPAEAPPTPPDPEEVQRWMAAYLHDLHDEWGGDEEVRMCHCMQGALIVSLGGAAKSHVLSFFQAEDY